MAAADPRPGRGGQRAPRGRGGRSGVDTSISAAVVAVSLALLAVFPLLVAADPDAAALAPLTPGSPRWWLLLVALAAQGSLVAFARQAPQATPVAVAAIALAVAFATPGPAYGLAGIPLLVAVLLAVLSAPVARLVVALAGTALLLAVGETVNGIGGEALAPGQAILEAALQVLAVVGGPILLGLVLRSRRDVRDARRDEQQARAGERDALVEAAVSRERTAMARELHDIAARHLSGIALMAAAVDRQIDTAPEEAHRGVRQLREQSMTVLGDLRRLVGLLREDADTNAERSVESLAAVAELVERARGATAVDLRVLATGEGQVLGAGVGPLAQLALYRTVQEALANAALHAPGAPCVVEIDDRDRDRVTVAVTNGAAASRGAGTHRTPSTPRPGAAGGFGLLGMRERAELVGAVLEYGPTDEGGWRVRMSVPRERAAVRDAPSAKNGGETA